MFWSVIYKNCNFRLVRCLEYHLVIQVSGMISNCNYSCRYEEPQVGISKAEQENNTAFQNLPFDPELRYADEMAQLTELTSQLNDTINQKLCFESDDEDCARKVLYVCNSSSLPDFLPIIEDGSGSGNHSDTEDTGTDAAVPTVNTNYAPNRPESWSSRLDDHGARYPDPVNVTIFVNDQSNSDSENGIGIEILDQEDSSPSTRTQPDQLINTSSANSEFPLRLSALFLFAYVVHLMAH